MTTLTTRSAQDFNRARAKAFFERFKKIFTRRPDQLLPFDTIQNLLGLHHKQDRHIREIEIDKVVGSVGRYRDFTRSFLPKKEFIEPRWRHLHALFYSQGFAPIEVYQVGEAYFVVDGNHRLSVSRSLGAKKIEAHVIELRSAVPIYQDDDLAKIRQRVNGVEAPSTVRRGWKIATILSGLLRASRGQQQISQPVAGQRRKRCQTTGQFAVSAVNRS
ncbi:MAG: hypothetical protein R3264_12615 [Anaerolineae bacterium]|nr:hypothetical protein [Anaerolineae bacterium]